MTQPEAQQKIAAGYVTDSPAITLGSVMVDGAADPQARVAIPLSMVNRHGLIAGATGTGKAAMAKTVKTYPESEVYDIGSALTSLGTGEALVTVLSERGAPTPVAWTLMAPPRSLMNTIGAEAVTEKARASELFARYGQTVDPVSAFEKLEQKAVAAEQSHADAEEAARQADLAREESRQQARGGAGGSGGAGGGGGERDDDEGFVGRALSNPAVRSFMRSAASAAGREITRSLFGTRRRRR